VFATTTPEGGLTLSQHSIVSGEVTLTANTEIELQAIFTHLHQFSATWGVNVFGSGGTQVPTTEGTTEQYSSLILERIA
jgi:hypothetical protein